MSLVCLSEPRERRFAQSCVLADDGTVCLFVVEVKGEADR